MILKPSKNYWCLVYQFYQITLVFSVLKLKMVVFSIPLLLSFLPSPSLDWRCVLLLLKDKLVVLESVSNQFLFIMEQKNQVLLDKACLDRCGFMLWVSIVISMVCGIWFERNQRFSKHKRVPWKESLALIKSPVAFRSDL